MMTEWSFWGKLYHFTPFAIKDFDITGIVYTSVLGIQVFTKLIKHLSDYLYDHTNCCSITCFNTT